MVAFLELFLLGQASTFVLILARVGGLVATAPLFGAESAPLRVRALLALGLALLVLPLQGASASAGLWELGPYAQALACEVVVGLLLGLGIMLVFSGVQVAGQIVAQISGMAIGEVFNPAFDSSVSPFTQMFYFVTIALFIAIGGHQMAVEALLDTFTWAPPGQIMLSDSFAEAMITLFSQSFELGLRASAPMLIALLLAHVVLGLISRTLPQINTIVVGFSANALLTLAAMFVSIGAVAWTFQDPLAEALVMLQETVRNASG